MRFSLLAVLILHSVKNSRNFIAPKHCIFWRAPPLLYVWEFADLHGVVLVVVRDSAGLIVLQTLVSFRWPRNSNQVCRGLGRRHERTFRLVRIYPRRKKFSRRHTCTVVDDHGENRDFIQTRVSYTRSLLCSVTVLESIAYNTK